MRNAPTRPQTMPHASSTAVSSDSAISSPGPRRHPLQRAFVLVAVERAGAVNERAARFQGPPRLAQDFILPRGALFHVAFAPFAAGVGVLAEHPLARAGGIDGHHVEPRLEIAQRTRLAGRDGHVARAPLAHVVRQYRGAAVVDLVGERPARRVRPARRRASSCRPEPHTGRECAPLRCGPQRAGVPRTATKPPGHSRPRHGSRICIR